MMLQFSALFSISAKRRNANEKYQQNFLFLVPKNYEPSQNAIKRGLELSVHLSNFIHIEEIFSGLLLMVRMPYCAAFSKIIFFFA